MPGLPHEVLLALTAGDPMAVVELIRDAVGTELASGVTSARSLDAAVPQAVAPDLDCDRVIELCAGERVAAIVLIEAQETRSKEKELTWPLYWATMRRRSAGAPTWLIVITTDAQIERWAGTTLAEVIPRAGRWLALGPTSIARVTDPAVARAAPRMGLLSGLVHAGERDDLGLVPAISEALSTIPNELGKLVYDALLRRLTKRAIGALEALVEVKGYQWQSDFALKHRGEGIAQGREEGRVAALRESVIMVIETRELPLTADQRETLAACTDVAQVETWLRRAVSAASVDEIMRDVRDV